ncbi:MAG TPA: hypothetical protein VMF57_09405 [Solirubrobacteraceae bacterium]|nr:hypothetical protein [Solirubrobacteraceae bacterium]
MPEQPPPTPQITVRRLVIVALGATCAGFLISLSFGFADHSPTPHDVGLAIAGPSVVAEHIQAGLDHVSPGGFKVVHAPSARVAWNEILDQSTAGALIIPPTGPTTTLTAAAGGLTLEQGVVTALTASSHAIGRATVVHDLVPLPQSDRAGLTTFVFELGLLIPAVLVSIGIFLVGRVQRLWYRVLGACGFVLLVAAADVIAQYGILGAFSTAPLATYGIGVLGGASFVLFVAACQAVLGISGTALGAVTFIFVGNALSGGTIPVSFLPNVYRQLARWVPNSAIVTGVRSVVYFGGRSLGHPLLVLSLWTGLALIVIAAVDLLHISELRRSAAPPHQIYAQSALDHLRARSQSTTIEGGQ